jgi:predicted anti-sigma-YlaC factor YlaD
LRVEAVQFLDGVIAGLDADVNHTLAHDSEARAIVESSLRAVAECREWFATMADTVGKYDRGCLPDESMRSRPE